MREDGGRVDSQSGQIVKAPKSVRAHHTDQVMLKIPIKTTKQQDKQTVLQHP